VRVLLSQLTLQPRLSDINLTGTIVKKGHVSKNEAWPLTFGNHDILNFSGSPSMDAIAAGFKEKLDGLVSPHRQFLEIHGRKFESHPVSYPG